jgi:periplasmic protein TonB
MAETGGFTSQRQRPRPALVALIVLLHVLALYGLTRALAPDVVAGVEESVVEAFTVIVTTPEVPPEPEPEPDAGAAGEEGREATAREVTAPEPPVPVVRPTPVPRAASTGAADTSGARDSGAGTGAAGSGSGTGSGQGGAGSGGGIATRAVKIVGDISNARDYPVPEGGRGARIGTSVTIAITVGTDGQPTACRILRPGPFPETNQRTCDLAMQRFRFRPALNRDGQPVVSEFGWRQDFFN